MRTLVARHARPILAAAAAAGLAWAGWSQRDAIASFDWSIDGSQLALSVALLAVAPLLQAATFAIGLRRVGAGSSAPASTHRCSRSSSSSAHCWPRSLPGREASSRG